MKILSRPNYLPIEINLSKDIVTLAKLEQKDFEKSIFILKKGEGKGFLQYQDIFSTDLSIFLNENKAQTKDPFFIFHHGFCCSTLLSRMLEARFRTLSLREPPCINWATHFKKDTLNWTAYNESIFQQLINIHGRTFRSNQRAIIKCSDYVSYELNSFIRPTTKAIFLYSDLSEFIGSCFKDMRHKWIAERADYSKLLNFLGYKNKLDLDDTATQVTIYWCFQIAKFLECTYTENVRSINTTRIFFDRNLIKSVGDFFDLKEKYFFNKNRNLRSITSSYAKTGDYEFSYEQRKKIITNSLSKIEIETAYFDELAKEILGSKIQKLESMKL